jgi:hypothetical protein
MEEPIHEKEKGLLLKEKRINHWEKYHSIPTEYDLLNSMDVEVWKIPSLTSC